jgi:hypothetical protein
VNRVLSAVLAANDHVACRQAVLAIVPDHVLEHALRRGTVTRLLPNVYVSSDYVDDVGIRERAALMYAGEGAALSHLSALRHWRLPVPGGVMATIHVTTPYAIRRRGRQGILVVHRSEKPLVTVHRSSTPVTRLERTVVDSWPLLAGSEQRAPAIAAIAERKTTPQRLMREAVAATHLKGRASLIALCTALDQGCRSELELWGFASRVPR